MDVERTLIQLAEISSGSANHEGLAEMAKLLQSYLSPYAPVKKLPLPGYPSACLSARKREKAPFQILLVGHIDTVFSKESNFRSCRKLSPTKLQGPGVCDMKGGIVTLLLLLEALEKEQRGKQIGWHVLLVPDEEIGSLYSKSVLKECCKKKDLALVFEPQIEKGIFSNKRKGSFNFYIEVQGKAAHAGRDFQKGKNAIQALTEWIYKAESLFSKKRTATFNIGKIEGGTAPNIVAEKAACSLNIRSYSLSLLEKGENLLQKLSKEIQEKRGVAITCRCISFRPPKLVSNKQKELQNLVQAIASKSKRKIAFADTGGVCDGNEIAAMGIPVLDTLGPFGGDIHTTKEWVDLSSIPEQARFALDIILTMEERKRHD